MTTKGYGILECVMCKHHSEIIRIFAIFSTYTKNMIPRHKKISHTVFKGRLKLYYHAE